MQPPIDIFKELDGQSTILLFDEDRPELLPYATLTAAKWAGDADLQPLEGVYEWQGQPLLFIVDGERLTDPNKQIVRLQKVIAMRGDAPYLGVVLPGRMSVYRAALDASPSSQLVHVGSSTAASIVSYLANNRPGMPEQRYWISDVVLRLLTSSLKGLIKIGVEGDDAISLVGRALFLRFLADRNLLPETLTGGTVDGTAGLFDNAEKSTIASTWLDLTFNGDFLPLDGSVYERLPPEAFLQLGNILRRAPGGQLSLGWSEKWDNLDFAHIPVGVLSQAYERYLSKYNRTKQKKEGSYYTPRHIADLMVKGAFHGLRDRGNVSYSRVLDPAAGAGVFLLTAFRELVAERWIQNGRRPDTDELRSILYEQITGLDINESALRFAALGLYLISIELDPNPEPVQKLRFENLRPNVLRNVSGRTEDAFADDLGSLGAAVGSALDNSFDLVIGNPPWATATRLKRWADIQQDVDAVARQRLSDEAARARLPNEVLDLPFVWKAMRWAKPEGQICLALHARILFLQAEGMPEARSAILAALDVTGIINGAELRSTNVWPEVSAPFCLLFARNSTPSPGAGFRFITPRLEKALNGSGAWRVDAQNADIVTSLEARQRPELLKVLFRGSRLDLEILDRLRLGRFASLGVYWNAHAENRPGESGNGYQRIRDSSVASKGNGEVGQSAKELLGLPHLTTKHRHGVLIEASDLPKFDQKRVHRARARSIFKGPLLLVKESPSVTTGKIVCAVCDEDVVYSQSYQGYSLSNHLEGELFARYLCLIFSSSLPMWFALLTSGRFGFEREVIEKFTLENFPIPAFESLSDADRNRISDLFSDPNEVEIDQWVMGLYKLSGSDQQVIADTLSFNLPFARNTREAQRASSSADREKFVAALQAELLPWADRSGIAIRVCGQQDLGAAGWHFVRIEKGGRSLEDGSDIGWSSASTVADQLGVTEILFRADDERFIWVGRLDQRRYWSFTQARLLARHLLWKADFLPLSPRFGGAR